MKTIYLTDVKDSFDKYWKYAVIIILILFLFFKCNSNQGLELANDELKKKAEVHKQLAKIFIQKNEFLVDKERKHLDSIKSLRAVIEKNKEEKKNIIIDKYIQIQKIKQFTRSQIANYIAERYESKDGVKTDSFGTSLTDTIGKSIVSELIEKDYIIKELDTTESILADTEIYVKQQEKIIEISKEKEVNLLSGISELNKSLDIKDDIVKNAQKQIRNERVKKNFWKTTTGIVVIASGYFLITK